MSPLELAIKDAIARVIAEDLEPRSIYLPADLHEQLGRDRVGRLPVKRRTLKGRAVIFTSRGLERAIRLPKELKRDQALKPVEEAFLIALAQGWPTHAPAADRRLRKLGLVAPRRFTRRLKGRPHTIEEPRLTGAGEEKAQLLWEGLDRDERAALRAQAMKAGL
jgi:hypothetical protein